MIKKLLRTPLATLALSVLAAGLIGFGGIRTIQAAPRVVSEYYGAQVQLTNIETALVENGTQVADGGELLTNLVPEGESFTIGKTYDEELRVRNIGASADGGIDEYVRVTVYRYWSDKAGNVLKNTGLKPEYIDLHFCEGNGWTIDAAASTPERTVLYYSDILAADGGTSKPFADKLAISSEVATAIAANAEREYDGEYPYEDVVFHVEAVVDAVQTHNPTDAKSSAWGTYK